MVSKTEEILGRFLNERSLSGNPLLKVLYNWAQSQAIPYWNRPEEYKNALIQIFKGASENTQISKAGKEKDRHKDIPQDLRVVALTANGIRAIPMSEIPCGLPFAHHTREKGYLDIEPESSVILGSNGSGKTTLYTAFELASLGRSLTTEARNLAEPNAQQNAILNAETEFDHDKASARLTTLSGTLDFNYADATLSERIRIPASFLCSEYDERQLEKEEITLEWMCEQLGIRNVYHLYRFIEYVQNAYIEAKELKKQLDQLNKGNVYILDIKDNRGIDENDKKSTARKSNPKANNNRANEKKEAFVNEYGISIESIDFTKLPKRHITALHKAIRKEINDSIRTLFEISNRFMPAIQKVFNYQETDMISIKLNDKKAENEDFISLSLQIYLGVDSPKAISATQTESRNCYETMAKATKSPREYYNTFRFKLYVLGLKISLAIATQRIHRINFPIVIDDIFESADFRNRHQINKFVKCLIKNYYNLKHSEKYPLQIILFTHDEVIADGFYRGMLLHSPEGNVTLSRLNHPHAVEDKDLVKAKFTNKSGQRQELFFKNLATRIH